MQHLTKWCLTYCLSIRSGNNVKLARETGRLYSQRLVSKSVEHFYTRKQTTINVVLYNTSRNTKNKM